MTLTAQNNIIIGFKILILSEVMAFFTCFWALTHFGLVPSIFILINFPPLSITALFPFSLCYFLCTRLVNGLLSLDYIIQLRIRGVVTSPGLCAYELYIVINCNICELDPVWHLPFVLDHSSCIFRRCDSHISVPGDDSGLGSNWLR